MIIKLIDFSPILEMKTLPLTKFYLIIPSVKFKSLFALQSVNHLSYMASTNCANGIRLELALLYELWQSSHSFFTLNELHTKIILCPLKTSILTAWVGWSCQCSLCKVDLLSQHPLVRCKDFPGHWWPNA